MERLLRRQLSVQCGERVRLVCDQKDVGIVQIARFNIRYLDGQAVLFLFARRNGIDHGYPMIEIT